MMTPKEAHEALIQDIMMAPPFVAGFGHEDGLNTMSPYGAGMAHEILDLAAKANPDANKNMWVQGSNRLKNIANAWSSKFGTVAAKLQAGQRFKPSELVKGNGNTLDPALKNNLADGWHHNPITQPLEAPTT